MHKEEVIRYRCNTCPYRKIYWGTVPKKVPGAYLTPGTTYCEGGKKVKAFKGKDRKLYPPSWCPRMKMPAEYRVYDCKDANVWYLHQQLRAMDAELTPSGPEYAIRAEGHTELTAHSFWKAIEEDSLFHVMGFYIYPDEILEIDDGLRPYFFHITEAGVNILGYFDCKTAKGNPYRGSRSI